MNQLRFVSLGLLLLASVTGAPSDLAADRDEGRTPCVGLDVNGRTSDGSLLAETDRRRVFSASRIEDLSFRLWLRRTLVGDHRVDIKVMLPGGQLYQTLSVPVSIEPAIADGAVRGPAGSRRIDGYPFPIEVQRPRVETVGLRQGELEVRVDIPVAGTAIATNSIYGDWTVEAHIDNEEAACAGPVTFGIRE